jgi:hypothetical protein
MMAALDLCRKEIIAGRRWYAMEVDEKVVMCNEATTRQLYTRGNNAVLLQHFFSDSAPIVCVAD